MIDLDQPLPTTPEQARNLAAAAAQAVQVPLALGGQDFWLGQPAFSWGLLIAYWPVTVGGQERVVACGLTVRGVFRTVRTELGEPLPPALKHDLEVADAQRTSQFMSRPYGDLLLSLLRTRHSTFMYHCLLGGNYDPERVQASKDDLHQQLCVLAAHLHVDRPARDIALTLAREWVGTPRELVQTVQAMLR